MVRVCHLQICVQAKILACSRVIIPPLASRNILFRFSALAYLIVPPSDTYVFCGWFDEALLVNSNTFKRIEYDYCYVNGGNPHGLGKFVRFVYANSFMYSRFTFANSFLWKRTQIKIFRLICDLTDDDELAQVK